MQFKPYKKAAERFERFVKFVEAGGLKWPDGRWKTSTEVEKILGIANAALVYWAKYVASDWYNHIRTDKGKNKAYYEAKRIAFREYVRSEGMRYDGGYLKTYDDLADDLGVAKATVNKWMKADFPEIAQEMSKRLGGPAHWGVPNIHANVVAGLRNLHRCRKGWNTRRRNAEIRRLQQEGAL